MTHTFGFPNDLKEIAEFCRQNDIILIEDIAEAIGVKYEGEYVGKVYGDFATASLYANKLITSGDGGFVISRHQEFKGQNLNEYFETLINHGFTYPYHFLHKVASGNSRMSGLAAAFAVCLP